MKYKNSMDSLEKKIQLNKKNTNSKGLDKSIKEKVGEAISITIGTLSETSLGVSTYYILKELSNILPTSSEFSSLIYITTLTVTVTLYTGYFTYGLSKYTINRLINKKNKYII